MIQKTVIGCILVCLMWAGLSTSVHAAQTVPYRINYQGQLTDDLNNQKIDGPYNIRFRIFNVDTGGAALWTETRDVAGGNGVDLERGLFNVQLGSISSLSPSLFTNQPLYLEVELPTPGTAMSSSPIWSEGAMTPRQPMASSVYAMNTDTVDGIDGASLAQLSANQTFSGNNTFSGTVVQQNTSATAFRVQNAGGTNALLVDTSGLTVKIGGGDVSPDASPALLVLDYKNTTGDPTGTNGAMYYSQATKKFRCYESGIWGDCIPESRTLFEHHADFLMGGTVANATGVDNMMMAGTLNTASFSRLTGELNHPGIVRLNLGTTFTQNGFAAIGSNFDSGNATAGIRFGTAVWTTSLQIRLNALSNASNNFASYNGFVDNLATFTTGALQNGCVVIHNYTINGGRWSGACSSGGTASTCNPLDSGSQQLAVVNTSAWYTLTTTLNAAGTLATFVVEGNGATGTCTVNTNMPTTTLSMGTVMYRLAGTGSGLTQDIDYIETRATGFSRN